MSDADFGQEDEAAKIRPFPKILSEKILSQQGSYQRVERYLEGWHPERGVLHMGWRGRETIERKDVIRPVKVFTVEELMDYPPSIVKAAS